MPDRMTHIRIKFCGVRTDADVDAAVDAGADAVGLVLAESPRRLEIAEAWRLARRVPPFVQTVAVFRQLDPVAVARARSIGAQVIQAEGTSIRYAALVGDGLAPLPVFRDGPDLDDRLNRFAEGREGRPMVQVDGSAPGSGQGADLHRVAAALAPLRSRLRVVLAGGLDPDSVGEAIALVCPFAVDVSSGVERARGIKDPGLMHAFVAAVRAAERRESLLDRRRAS